MTTAPALPAWNEARASRRAHVLALVRLTARSVRAGGWSRVGRLYAWSIAVGYAALALFLGARGDREGLSAVVPAALAAISWPAGLVAWAAARGPEPRDGEEALRALAAPRGIGPGRSSGARLAATIQVVGSAAGFPAFALALLAFGIAPSERAAITALGVGLYAAWFGGVLGVLAFGAARVSAKHGRALFALAVLGPPVVGGAWARAGVVSWFSWFIRHLAALGGAA